MRADRLIKIILSLQSKGKLTTKQLAEEVEVSQRTILRDMDALTMAGIPVVAERGINGGWKLMDHFRSAIGDLHLEELKALFIVPSESILEALNITASGTTIRQSLLAKLPAASKGDAQQYFNKIYIDTGTWKPTRAASTALQDVQLALWENRKLAITYQKANGDCSQRIVCPLGLVAKGSTWYLVALNEQGEHRSFKVSRIAQAEVQAEAFTRPEAFNLGEYWKQSKLDFVESLPTFEISVLAHRSILSRMSFTDKFVNRMEILQAEAAANEPMVHVALRFNSEQEAVEYVLGFGGMMKLLQPSHLVDQIVEQARQAIAQYE